MIKIQRTPCPEELNEENRRILTDEYKKLKKSVWNKRYIKEALFEMSEGKCVFCECKLCEESKYMEIEHFYPKSLYPDEVVDWNNLLPICKRCNVQKKDYDTKKCPIINPTIDDPKDHLFMCNYRFKGKNQLGNDTIELLELNDSDRLVGPRFSIGDKLADIMECLHREILDLGDLRVHDEIKVNNKIGRLKRLLRSCLPEKEYSATCSSVLLKDRNYHNTVDILKKYDCWDEELEELQKKAMEICLIDHILQL